MNKIIEYLFLIEFAHNRVVYKTTKISLFEVMYGFNPLIPLDLVSLSNPHEFIYKKGVSKDEFVKKLHKKVRNQIQEQTKRYRNHNNKGKREVIFEEGDWV